MLRSWAAESWGRRIAVEAARPNWHSATLRFLGRVVWAGPILLVAVGAALWAGSGGSALVASKGAVSLWRDVSGLATSVSFRSPLPLRDLGDAFTFNGSASPGIGYAALGRRGLAVGVQRHPDRFEGWFAVTNAAYPAAGAYHVRMDRPPGNVDGGRAQGEAVFAVQTGTTSQNGLINYVVVASNSTGGTTFWTIGYAHGHVKDARLQILARTPASVSSPTGREITLQTDGRRRLAVYFGRTLVFASNRLHLNIEPPFQAYLEVQSRRVPYTSFFHDFWVTNSTSVTVAGVSSGARLSLIGPDGRVFSSATSHGGEARLDLPVPLARGKAELLVQAGSHRVRLGPFAYSGGDAYRVSGLSTRGGGASPT
ncbi:MAG TPA: hypothetical protein VMU76_06215 [Acidimicrobiales bacterium]|nr:hypothetical protein [Acidimicrobiales bacterium]